MCIIIKMAKADGERGRWLSDDGTPEGRHRVQSAEVEMATGRPLFLQLHQLNQGHGYLKGPTVYIQVVVETGGMDT